MKPDITNGRRILSRENRVGVFALFFIFFIGFQSAWADSGVRPTSLSITVEELRLLPREQVALVDTRSSWKFLLAHIPGAVNLSDWEDFTRKIKNVPGLLIEDPRWIVQKLRPLGIDVDKTIVIYGDPENPWRTDGRFFWMFERYGFPSVALLKGGLQAWTGSGGEVERGTAGKRSPSQLDPSDLQLNPEVIADRHWIRERLGSPGLVLVDNRTAEEFQGATPYGSRRGGHIPHAVHIPWQNFFDDKGWLKPESVLGNLLKRHGIQPGKTIVVYCTGGVRSGMAYFVFRVLGYSVRNYDGSWWDWSSDPALPVELS